MMIIIVDVLFNVQILLYLVVLIIFLPLGIRGVIPAACGGRRFLLLFLFFF